MIYQQPNVEELKARASNILITAHVDTKSVDSESEKSEKADNRKKK